MWSCYSCVNMRLVNAPVFYNWYMFIETIDLIFDAWINKNSRSIQWYSLTVKMLIYIYISSSSRNFGVVCTHLPFIVISSVFFLSQVTIRYYTSVFMFLKESKDFFLYSEDICHICRIHLASYIYFFGNLRWNFWLEIWKKKTDCSILGSEPTLLFSTQS